MQVELVYHPDRLGVRVRNDASDQVAQTRIDGFPAVGSSAPSGGHGLIGMQERAAMLGGDFHAGRRQDGSAGHGAPCGCRLVVGPGCAGPNG